jgi:hypothetical protein
MLHKQHPDFIYEGIFLKIGFEVIKAPEKIIVERHIGRKMKYDVTIKQDRDNTNQYGEILKSGEDSEKSGHTKFQFGEA